MKIFRNKFLVKLIATLCLFLTLLNFAGASKVYAEDQVWGGVLIKPVVNLMTAIGDSIMEILHKSIQAQGAAIIKINGSETWWDVLSTILAAVAGILLAVAFIAAIVATGGVIGAAIGALTAGVGTFTVSLTTGTVVAGAVIGYCAGVALKAKLIPEDIYLPAFSITAEEIFNNSIPLFDVNFFDPMDDKTIDNPVVKNYGHAENGIVKAFLDTGEYKEKYGYSNEYYYRGTAFYTANLTDKQTTEWMEITDEFMKSITTTAGETKYKYSRN